MRLGSTGGPVVTLQPAAYQFPGAVAVEPRDWDANWLVIDGSVTAADDIAWRFSCPCLTTWEAAELGGWLRAVVAGTIAPVALDGAPLAVDGLGPDGLLVFTEPMLAFSLAGRAQDEVKLRVHLSSRARPPQPSGAAVGLFGYFVTLSSSCADLAGAVAVWDRELASFPVR